MAQKKKKYGKPKIVHRQKIEVLGAKCDTPWVGPQECMKTCVKPLD